MKNRTIVAFTSAFLLLSILGLDLHADKAGKEHPKTAWKSKHALQLKLSMRTLWQDHISYTRGYIVSALAGLEDTDAVAKRLLKNQDDIGNAIKPYYGKAAGEKLTALLRDHILIATVIVAKAKAGDKEGLKEEQERWAANSEDVAEFLSGANPHWKKSGLLKMMLLHLKLTTGEVKARLSKDWAEDIENYDEGHKHMLMFSDELSSGIVKQFPKEF